MSYLLFSELQHFLLTLGIAFLLFWRYRDWRLIPVCFVFGFLIDIDHCFDYFVYYGFDINLARFFNFFGYFEISEKVLSEKVFVPLHGWEYVPLFWLISKGLGKKLKIKNLEWAVTLPYFGHLLIDNFSFSHHPLAYSFLYRLFNSFSSRSFNGF